MNLSRIPVFIWFLIPTILVIGVGIWFFSRPAVLGELAEGTGDAKPVSVSNPVEGTIDYDVVGRNHIAQGTSGSGYNSDPPSSGPHWGASVKNGVYDSPLPDEQLIHNLEHGHVWIAYRFDAPDEAKAKLKEIVEKDDWKVVLAPREKNQTMITLAAWGRVLAMDQFDEVKVKDFIKTYRNRGPEKTPD